MTNGSDNPYQSPNAAQSSVDASKVTFRFSDPMPSVCVACAAEATGLTLLRVKLKDRMAKERLFARAIGLALGHLIFWNQTRPSEKMVSFPTCDAHKLASILSRIVTVTAIDHYSANLFCASPEFRSAFEIANAPPSPELLASLHECKVADPSDFLNELSKSDIKSPREFLKGLERDS